MQSYKNSQQAFNLMTNSQREFRFLALSTAGFISKHEVVNSIIHIKCYFPQYANVYPKEELDFGYKMAAIYRDSDYLQWFSNDKVFFNKSLGKYKGLHYWEFLEQEFDIYWLDV